MPNDPRFRRFSPDVRPEEPRAGTVATQEGDPRFRRFAAEDPRAELTRGPAGDISIPGREPAGRPSPLARFDPEVARAAMHSTEALTAGEAGLARAAGAAAAERRRVAGDRRQDPRFTPEVPVGGPTAAPESARVGGAEGVESEEDRQRRRARAAMHHDDREKAPLGAQLKWGATLGAHVGRELAASVPETLGILAAASPRPTGGRLGLGLDELKPPEVRRQREEIRARQGEALHRSMMGIGEFIRGDDPVPDDPRVLESWLANNLMPGMASMFGFLAVGIAAGPMGAGILAATSGQSRAWHEAKERGLTDEEAQRAALAGTVPGVIQVLTPVMMLRRMQALSGGTALQQLRHVAQTTGMSAVNEMIVNSAGEVGFNVIAQRPAFENFWTAFRDGGAVAAVTSALIGGPQVGMHRYRSRRHADNTREAIELVDAALELGMNEQGEAATGEQLQDLQEVRAMLEKVLAHHTAELGQALPPDVRVEPEAAVPAAEAAQTAEEASARPEGRPEPPAPVETRPEAPAARETEEGAVPLRTTPEGEVISPVVQRGRESEVVLADGRRLPVQYSIVDARGTVQSHDPVTFQRNPLFPEGIQDRRYHADPVAQDEVAERSSRLDPSILLDSTARATDGPAIIREDGIKLSGNQRNMLLLRAAELHPDRLEAYVEELAHRAPEFGLEVETAQAEIRRALQEGGVPELARVLTGEQETGAAALGELMAAFNETAMKARDPLGEARVLADRLERADGALEHLEATIGPDQTVRAYLATAPGAEFFQRLVQEGVIPRQQAGRFVSRRTGTPNSEGRTLVERMLLAAAIQDADVIDQAPPGWLRKLEKGVPALIEAQQATGWDLTAVLQEALELGAAVQAAEGAPRVEDITGQIDLTGRRFSVEAEDMARFIEAHGPNQVTEALRRYARLSRESRRQHESHDLFGADPVSAREVFRDIFQEGREPLTEGAVALAPLDAPTVQIGVPVQEGVLAPPEELARIVSFGKSPNEIALEGEQLLAELEADPRIQEAQQRPQPGDPGTTASIWPRGDAERAPVRARALQVAEENAGFRSRERWLSELGIAEPYQVARDRTLVILTGPPASGKSTLANPILRQLKARLADSDEFKALLPENEGGRNAGAVHEESSWLVGDALGRAMERGENIVYPTVGRTLRTEDGSGLLDQVEAFEEAGYKVHVVLNDLPHPEAARRALARWEAEDRWLDPHYVVRLVGAAPAENWPAVKHHPSVTSAQRWSNDVAFGEPPVFLDGSGLAPRGLDPRGIAAEIAAGAGRPGGRERPSRGPGGPQVPPGAQAAPGPPAEPGVTAPEVALEVQDDLLGGPPVLIGEQQRDMFPERPMQDLTSAEIQARRTIERLQPLVEADRASNADLEAYREALALLRREELVSAEEITPRARRLEREEARVREAAQAEMFELRPTERVAPESQDLHTPQAWQRSLEDFAGEDRGRRRVWMQETLEAISEGELSLEEATGRGFEWHGEEFRPLPPDTPLYHVTTARSGVLAIGLRSRAQIGLERGNGLGGDDASAISFTASLEMARGIRDGILLAGAVLRGTVSAQELVAQAEQGEGASRPWSRTLRAVTPQLQGLLDGRVPAAELLEARMQLVRNWLWLREESGGPKDPLFMEPDPVALRDVHPAEVAILEARAEPGAVGNQLEALDEWRTYSGRAVRIDRVDGRSPDEFSVPTSPTQRGWARARIREEVAKELPLEPRRSVDVLPDVPEFARAGAETAPSISQIKEDMERVLGIPFRVGRLRKLARAFGIYQVTPETVRTRMAGDIQAIAHELGHHLHKLIFMRSAPDFDPASPARGLDVSVLEPWAHELRPLGLEIGHDGLAEGWAEYWRRWVTNREVAERRAPELTRWLTGRLQARFPEVWDGVLRWQDWMEAHAQAAPWARVESRISRPESLRTRLAQQGERGFLRLYQEIMDRFAPLEVAQREILGMRRGQRIDDLPVSVEDIPILMADLIAGAGGMADHFIRRAPVDFKTGRPRDDVKSLAGAIAPVLDHLDAFEAFMIAKRALHLQTERGLDQGFENSDLEATLRHYEAKHPEFVQAAEDVHAYQEALLDYMVDGGVLTREAQRAFREGNPFYVPLYKVQDPNMKGGRGTGTGGNDHLFSPFKRIGNSSRDIVPVLESIIKNTHFYTKLVQKQKVQAALANLADTDGAGRWITPIDESQVIAAKVPKGELTTWMRREVEKELLGTPATRLDQDFMAQVENLLPELFLVWRPGDYFGKENVISHLQVVKDPKTGESRQRRFWYEVDPLIYRALTHTPDAGRSALVRALSIPAQTLRVGATTALEFIGRNPFRDQTVAFVQSEYGYTPGIDLARGIFHIVGKTDQYWKWKAAGGEFATLVDMDRNATINSIRRMEQNPVPNVIKHPFGALQALAATMENATRMGEFLNAVRAGGEKKGVLRRWLDEIDPEFRSEAAERLEDPGRHLASLGAWNSREISTQYSTHGAADSIQIMRMISTFWNARIQSYKRLIRAFREDPAGASLRSLVSITLPTLALYAINREDEEYWELPQWQRDWFWLVKVPNFTKDMIPRALTADQEEDRFVRQLVSPFVNEGETTWLRFPIPWELGLVFKTLPERILEWMDTDDPEGLQESLRSSFWQQVTGTVLPIPTAVEPLVENWANYSFFMQRNIDPVFEGPEPRFIERGGTSEVAKGLAAMLHGARAYDIPGMERLAGSPQKIDNMLWSWTGGLGRMAIDIVDEGMKQTGVVERAETRPPVLSDVPGIRGFTARDPGLNSESIQRFRRRWRAVDRARQTINLLEREERTEQLERELEDPRVQELLDLWPEYSRVNAQLSRYFAEANMVGRDPGLTAEQKLAELREIGQAATELAREVIGRELPGDRPFPLGRRREPEE